VRALPDPAGVDLEVHLDGELLLPEPCVDAAEDGKAVVVLADVVGGAVMRR